MGFCMKSGEIFVSFTTITKNIEKKHVYIYSSNRGKFLYKGT